MTMPSTLISIADLQARRQAWERDGVKVAFVPTMGALHQGHLSLVKQARDLADRVIVSIFVNPTQFGPGEDLSRYPRTLSADLELLASENVEAVFLPSDATMYPDGFQTYLHGKGMALQLEGSSRKHHFEGVLTVVLKLFNLVQPHVAIFGKKDYQQWRLIEQMVADLNLPVKIIGCETKRELDGLAMSSRNRYLSERERQLAPSIYQGLLAAKAGFAAGEHSPEALISSCRNVIEQQQDFVVDYIELCQRRDLLPCGTSVAEASVMLVAVRLGTTRLIDNMEMD